MNFVTWATQYNKAFVGIVMIGVYLLNKKYGIELPVNESTAVAILGMLVSAITWAVPNTKA